MKPHFRYILTVLFFLSAIIVTAQERVQPIEGDGIYSLLRRHGRAVPGDVQEFRELNQGRFNARGHLILGRYYILPPLRNDVEPIEPVADVEISIPQEEVQVAPTPSAPPVLERVRPVDGDGVYSLLIRHGRSVPGDVRAFRELNQGRLNARGGLILGRYYYLPPLRDGVVVATTPAPIATPTPPVVTNRGTDPAVFGSRFSNITRTSNQLEGAAFYIIAGHGGPDPGAITRIGNRSLHEVEYNYDFALRLARNLMMHGATVHVIIQTPHRVGIRDERYLSNHRNQTTLGEPIPRGQMERLRQRVDAVNRLYEIDRQNHSYIRAIEIHIDSRNARQQIDLFMYYYSEQPRARETAYTLLREMERQYRRHQPNRGFSGSVSHRSLYILRHMQPPTIMVEVGNFQNERDRMRILDHNNRQAVANWLTNGLIEDFRIHRNQ